MPVLEVNSELADAAFGVHPERAAIGLPAAADARESWLRAVALAGVGHYAAARAELARARRAAAGDPALLSLTHSTEGSLLRQLGWHSHAAVADGRAAAAVLPAVRDRGAVPAAAPADIAHAEAVCDALTGLAADALGTLRPALAARLLDRCRQHLDVHLPDAASAWRPRLRLHWVSAETALSAPGSGLISAPAAATAAGPADPALAHAEAAVALAENSPSLRHRVKSRLLLAAAGAAAGDLDRSRTLAIEVDRECREHELLPLRWACAMLRSGVDPAGDGAEVAAACARLLDARGGRLRSASEVLGHP
ncbi:hypothetical protein [Nocardia seriolae]|uniref:Uncharacterized protein n=1 Tax=Nocardia seriolae TaxID=37332 RepID=A0ABC9YPE8_9NOCA|nr:hypothetical protein [Nocardia seriolae]APB01459.1 hypothetical protein NS506_07439 [Nocardia seriolae]MTJ61053.1 hypothetical protein [Nocardia seriolae]MTJ70486.1 hypothetical protein [Nocardia seriolae]MTK51390.1 hypothetical protein [Nocardia seriolae]OJF78449.1 hypothetical protein NS14008_03430 [Nocardia seriolae]